MSIEQTLERIAVGIEKLIEMQGVLIQLQSGGATAPTAPAPVAAPAPTNVAPFPQQAAPMLGPSGTGPGQAVPPAAPMPVPGPQAAPAPMAQPAVAPAVNTGLSDQIRDAANQFHRAHPERAGEVWQIFANNGSTGGIDAIPPQSQQQVLRQLQALGA